MASRPLKIQAIIQEALRLLRATLPTTIEFRLNLEETPLTVMGDPIQVHQVMMNICTNAAHAMAGGGILQINLGEVAAEDVAGNEPGGLDGSRWVKLSIADTGQGMDESLLSKVFDPFFTTKETGKGTGMGLAVVHGIVTVMGGVISVSSEPERGSTFDIFLPLLVDGQEAPRPPSQPLKRGTERILLVDNEVDLVKVGRRQLEKLGYEVETRTDSQEALDVFEADPYGFDVVITDQTMPQLTGLTLSRKILALRPGLPIILYIGYSESIDPDIATEQGIREFLTKPFVFRELAAAVRRALDATL